MEDNKKNERQPKKRIKEDDLKKMEDDLKKNGRRPQKKMKTTKNKLEDHLKHDFKKNQP